MLTPNPYGNYHFLPGGDPYSSGVVANPGYEIVHVTLTQLREWRDGFELIDAHLRAAGLTRQALCGVELRSPKPFTRAGFIEFNRGYRALLDEWGLLVDGENPIARTNVAPAWNPPAEESLFGFSYLIPTQRTERTFVVAGGGELRGGPMLEAAVIRPGDASPEGLREKAEYVMKAMTRRLEGLGMS
ncbi:MAG: 2-amino-5-chloromuconate deaminase CnbZ, partial [Actinomycetota bacterium]